MSFWERRHQTDCKRRIQANLSVNLGLFWMPGTRFYGTESQAGIEWKEARMESIGDQTLYEGFMLKYSRRIWHLVVR